MDTAAILGVLVFLVTPIRFYGVWKEDGRIRRPAWLATYAVAIVMPILVALLTRMADVQDQSSWHWTWLLASFVVGYAVIAWVKRSDLKSGRYTPADLQRFDKKVNDSAATVMIGLVLFLGRYAWNADGHSGDKLVAVVCLIIMVAVILFDGYRHRPPFQGQQQTY